MGLSYPDETSALFLLDNGSIKQRFDFTSPILGISYPDAWSYYYVSTTTDLFIFQLSATGFTIFQNQSYSEKATVSPTTDEASSIFICFNGSIKAYFANLYNTDNYSLSISMDVLLPAGQQCISPPITFDTSKYEDTNMNGRLLVHLNEGFGVYLAIDHHEPLPSNDPLFPLWIGIGAVCIVLLVLCIVGSNLKKFKNSRQYQQVN